MDPSAASQADPVEIRVPLKDLAFLVRGINGPGAVLVSQ